MNFRWGAFFNTLAVLAATCRRASLPRMLGLSLATLVLALPALALSENSADLAEIAATLKQDFDRPEAPLAVSPIVSADDWALAGWTQGEMGGLALLRRIDGKWAIRFCANNDIRAATALAGLGLPAETANRLAEAMATAEARESPERIEKLGRFKGVMPMEPQKSEAKP